MGEQMRHSRTNRRFRRVETALIMLALSGTALPSAALSPTPIRRLAALPTTSFSAEALAPGELAAREADLIFPPSQYEPQTSFYAQHLAQGDPEIRRLHWGQSAIPFPAAGAPGISPDSRSLAERVFMLRLSSGLRSYFAQNPAMKDFERAHRAIERVRRSSVRLGGPSNANEPPTELRFGYDLYSDASRLEIGRGAFGAGLFHPRLFGALSGRSGMVSSASFQVKVAPSAGIPNVGVSLRLDGSAVETWISHPLGRSVHANLATASPLRGTTQAYQMTLLFGL